MTEQEAVQRADALLFKRTGKIGKPCHVRLERIKKGVKRWYVLYGAEVFFPEIYTAGGGVDGGEMMIKVDDATGEAFIDEHP